jgi:FkbM family methyltransferase
MEVRSLVPRALKATVRRPYLEALVALTGAFPYFSQRVHTPRKSVIFQRILASGVFEPEIVDALVTLAKPNSTVVDVGANIGVMSIAMLNRRHDVSVVSVECSPSTLPFLRKTHATSSHRNRWTIVEAAISNTEGEVSFFTSGSANGAYDSLSDTGRGGDSQEVRVLAAKLDTIWTSLGRPQVSIIKVDIEGGEFGAIESAQELISACRPIIIFEWNKVNLRAYNLAPDDLFKLPLSDYEIFAIPSLTPIHRTLLPLIMRETEMFLATPAEQKA